MRIDGGGGEQRSTRATRRKERIHWKMGSTQSLETKSSERTEAPPQRRRTYVSESASHDHPSSSSGTSIPPQHPYFHHHPHPAQRSNSVPSARYRQDSVGSTYSYSAYSSSMEGGYSDHGDGMQPVTFGGDYHKAVPRIKDGSQNFNAAHGQKLKIPLDSKQGSGFDLDWQYNDKTRRRVIAQRSLSKDHPLYHRLTPRITEEGPTASTSRRA